MRRECRRRGPAHPPGEAETLLPAELRGAVTPGEEARTLGRLFDAARDVPGQAWKRDYLRVTSELAIKGDRDAQG